MAVLDRYLWSGGETWRDVQSVSVIGFFWGGEGGGKLAFGSLNVSGIAGVSKNGLMCIGMGLCHVDRDCSGPV